MQTRFSDSLADMDISAFATHLSARSLTRKPKTETLQTKSSQRQHYLPSVSLFRGSWHHLSRTYGLYHKNASLSDLASLPPNSLEKH